MNLLFRSKLIPLILFGLISSAMAMPANAPLVTVVIEEISVRKPAPHNRIQLRSTPTVSIYPNPATTQLTVSPGVGTTLTHLKIVSTASGTTYLDTAISGAAQHRLYLPTGTYSFLLQTSGGQLITKTVEIL